MTAELQQSDKGVVDIVFVHGLHGNGTASWCYAPAPTATLESIQIPGIRVREYDSKDELTEEFDWESFLDLEASSLLVFLGLNNSVESPRPVILVGHGLGGTIIKYAIKILIDQNYQHQFLDRIIGLIFLGTPHFIRPDKTREKQFEQILRADLRSVSRRTLTKRGFAVITSANMAFDEWRTQVPILTAYETRETKLRGPFYQRAKSVLAPVGFVKTKAQNEKLEALDVAMDQLFTGTAEAVAHQSMKRLIQEALAFEAAKLGPKNEVRPPSLPRNSRMSITSSYGSPRQPISPISPVSPDRHQLSSSPTGSLDTDHSLVIVPPISPRIPCFFMDQRPRNAVFSGRSGVLEQLDELLLSKSPPGPYPSAAVKAPRACALWGLGGVGKTQIAIEWAYSRKSHFDVVLWANAKSREQLDVSFSQISERLGLLPESNRMSARTIMQAVKEWLADPLVSIPSVGMGIGDLDRSAATQPVTRASWLLILDNVGNPDDLRGYWPEESEGSILLTSRDPKVAENWHFSCHGINLGPFSHADSIEFFRRMLEGLLRRASSPSDQATEVALYQIADRLRHFPLHMTAVASLMKQRDIMPHEFLLSYVSLTDMAKLYTSEVPEYGERRMAMASTWGLESLPEGAAALLGVTSLLSTTGIPEDILRQRPEGALSIGFPQDAVSYFEHLSSLSHSSLTTRNIQEKSIFVHDIVQDVTHAFMQSTEGRMEKTFEATVALVSAVWPFVTVALQPGYAEYRQNARWSQCERIYPHLVSLKEAFEKYLVHQVPNLDVGPFLTLLNEMAWYQLDRCNPSACRDAANLAFRIVEERDSPEFRKVEAAVHGTLQQLDFDNNNPKGCLFHAQQALMIEEEIAAQTGERNQKLAVSLSEMGKACSRNKLYHKALDYYKESRAIRESLQGFKPAALFTYHVGTGHALWLLGRYEEASDCIETALQLQRDMYNVADDTTSHRTGLALFALGNIRLSQGDVLKAHSLHQRALRQLKISVGENHIYYGAACYKDGEHNSHFGEYEFAKLRFETALRIFANDASYRPEIARTTFQLGRALVGLGSTEKGEQCILRAGQLYRELVPHNHIDLADLEAVHFDELICFWWR